MEVERQVLPLFVVEVGVVGPYEGPSDRVAQDHSLKQPGEESRGVLDRAARLVDLHRLVHAAQQIGTAGIATLHIMTLLIISNGHIS
jgi:hypothetical protein